jgi:hypothetical protein
MEEVLKGWTFLVTNQFAVSIGVRTPWRGAAAGTEAHPVDYQPGDDQPVDDQPVDDQPVDDQTDNDQSDSGQSGGESPPVRAAHGPRLQPYPFDLFMGSLGGDSYDFERYSVAAPVSAAAEPALAWQARGRMHVGSSMLLRAGLDMVTSRLAGSLVYLEISGPVQCAILPQFDQITHRFAGWISGDSTASRLELLTRTLAEFEFQPAAPRLAALTRHRDHYVRWNSLRDLLRLDPELGLEHLQHALADEHAEIRELAGWTLGRVARERQAFRAVAQES